MEKLSLRELSEGLKARKFSSVELTQFFLDRLEKYNLSINAFISIDKDKSLAMASRSDLIIKEGKQEIGRAPSLPTPRPMGVIATSCRLT